MKGASGSWCLPDGEHPAPGSAGHPLYYFAKSLGLYNTPVGHHRALGGPGAFGTYLLTSVFSTFPRGSSKLPDRWPQQAGS